MKDRNGRSGPRNGSGVLRVLLAFLMLFANPGLGTAEVPRLVPQFALTSLSPIAVAAHPRENDIVLVLNEGGRIDVLNIGSDRPMKFSEINAGASSVAISPDGDRIVTGGGDGAVRLWTLEGEPVGMPFEGHRGKVRSVAFGPAGDRIASGGADGTVRLWTLDGDPVGAPFEGHGAAVLSVFFHPVEDRIISVGLGGTLHHGTSGGERGALHGLQTRPFSAALNPSGDRIATGASGSVGGQSFLRLWALDGRPIDAPFRPNPGTVHSVAFSPAGDRIVSGGKDGTLRLWTLDGVQVGAPFYGHGGAVVSIAFSSAGDRIISGGTDGTLRLWTPEGYSVGLPFGVGSAEPGEWLNAVAVNAPGDRIASGGSVPTLWSIEGRQLNSPESSLLRSRWIWILSAAFSPEDDRIVTGDSDGKLTFWNQEGAQVDRSDEGHEGAVRTVAFSPDGDRIVSGGDDGALRLWTRDGAPVGVPGAHEGPVYSVAFSPAGDRIVSGGTDGTVRLWTRDGDSLTQVDGRDEHEGLVLGVAFSPAGGQIVSSGEDGTVRLWRLDDEPVGAPFEGHEGAVLTVAFNASGDRIISGGRDGTLRLWALNGRQVGTTLRGHHGAVFSVAVSTVSDRFVSGGADNTLRLWTLHGGPIGVPVGGGRYIDSVALAPSGDQIFAVLASERQDYRGRRPEMGSAVLWTLEDGYRARLGEHEGTILAAAFSPAGDRIASGGRDGTVQLWMQDGQPDGSPFAAHEGPVRSVAFSSSGDRIASGGNDGTLRLWTLDGDPVGPPFTGHDGAVLTLAFNPTDGRIVSGGADGTVRLWNLDGTQEAPIYEGPPGWVQSVAFNAAGTRITAGGTDGRLLLLGLHDLSDLEISTIQCPGPIGGLSTLGTGHSAFLCGDRIAFVDARFRMTGTVFLNEGGLVAIVPGRGVYATSEDHFREVRALGDNRTLLTHMGAVPSIRLDQLRQSLLGQYTPLERVQSTLGSAWTMSRDFYNQLSWLQMSYLVPVLWLLVVLVGAIRWIVAPAGLAAAAMPATGAPPPPPVTWLLQALSLHRWFGSTRRPLRAWLRRVRPALVTANFSERAPVRERDRFSPLGQEREITTFGAEVASGREAVRWIHGAGGSGKSALAFEIARRNTLDDPRGPVPVLIDADWQESLVSAATVLLRPPKDARGPTETMTTTLGSLGLIVPIVDSLSERRTPNAEEHVTEALRTGTFRHLIVTSRSKPPPGHVWDGVRQISPSPVRPEDIRRFIEAYVPDAVEEVASRIRTLIMQEPMPGPLFLRFAVEEAVKGDLQSTDKVDLVLHYVEAVRAGRVDLNPDDMIRAVSVAALEAVREDGIPREIDRLHLRGTLQAEDDRLPFIGDDNAARVPPSRIIVDLVRAGILNEVRVGDRVQFAYDPVAEFLAARWLLRRDELKPLRERLAITATPLARALRPAPLQGD